MTRVVVCGAGPAGATLAVTLARRGIDTVLVERHTDLAREFRGEWLTLGGQIALREMDFGREMDRLPSIDPSAGGSKNLVFIGGKLRMEQGMSIKPEKAPRLIPQPLLLQAIIDKGLELAEFSYRPGTIVRDLVEDNGRVAGITVESHDGLTEQIEADLVIGTDGRTSVVRRRMGVVPPHSDASEDYDVVWFNLPAPTDGLFPAEAHLFLEPHSTLFFHPYPGGQLQFGFVVDKGTFGDIRRAPGGWSEAVATRLPEPYATYVRTHGPDAQPALLDVKTFLLDAWHAPGVVLLGDAAHPMSPVGGQGINLALRDVVVALNRLSPVLMRQGTHDEIDSAAAMIRGEREPEVVRIQALQHRGANILHQRTRTSRFLIQRVLPVVSKIGGPLLERGVGTTKEFTNGVTDVTLLSVPTERTTTP